jgi:hypothetical protein
MSHTEEHILEGTWCCYAAVNSVSCRSTHMGHLAGVQCDLERCLCST